MNTFHGFPSQVHTLDKIYMENYLIKVVLNVFDYVFKGNFGPTYVTYYIKTDDIAKPQSDLSTKNSMSKCTKDFSLFQFKFVEIDDIEKLQKLK